MLVRAGLVVQGTQGRVILEKAGQALQRDLGTHAAHRLCREVDAVCHLATEGHAPLWVTTTDKVSSLILGIPEIMPGSTQ